MNECYIDKEKNQIVISVYHSNGYMLRRRDALDLDDPESEYQCLIRLGENPEDHGYDLRSQDINYFKCKYCGKLNKVMNK